LFGSRTIAVFVTAPPRQTDDRRAARGTTTPPGLERGDRRVDVADLKLHARRAGSWRFPRTALVDAGVSMSSSRRPVARKVELRQAVLASAFIPNIFAEASFDPLSHSSAREAEL
jgi:hypothetical protein